MPLEQGPEENRFQKEIRELRELRDKLAKQRCERCGDPLYSLRRKICPPCQGFRRKYGEGVYRTSMQVSKGKPPRPADYSVDPEPEAPSLEHLLRNPPG